MTRAGRMLAGAMLIGAMLVGLTLVGCGAPEPRGVLLVTIDTCRADRLGCYGATSAITPTLDALAANGALFLQASATAPITAPSHASILTGLYPDRHTVRDNGAGRLPDEAVTLAETFADAGWNTAAFLAAVPLDAVFGTDQGFATYDDDFVELPDGATLISRLDTDQRIAGEVAELALPWLRNAAESRAPWFAWVHFFDPHSPYTAPGGPPGPGRSAYDGEITYVDTQLARLLAVIDDDTVVAVIADHGEALGEHGEKTHGFFLYDDVLRVPWILRGPGVAAGVRVATAVSAVQVMPTLLELAGLPVPPGIDGRSALARLSASPRADDQPVFAEALFPRLNFGWSGTRSVRSGGWKLIEAPELELYHVAEDPTEQHNVLAEHPEIVSELLEKLHAHADRGGELEATPSEVGDEMLARLEGLGYLGVAGNADSDAELWDFTRRNPADMIDMFHELERLPTKVLSGTREEADAFADALRAMDPDNVQILKRIARIRIRASHWDAARSICRDVVALAPDDLEAWRNLATVETRTGRRDDAIAALARTVELAPADTVGLRLLSTQVNERASELKLSGDVTAALDLLYAHLEALSEDVTTRNNLAWTLANRNLDVVAALEHARKARELAPDDPIILDTFGWAAIRAGHPEDAVEPLRRALALTSDSEVRAHLGIALCAAGRADEGRPLLKQATTERRSLLEIPEVSRWTP